MTESLPLNRFVQHSLALTFSAIVIILGTPQADVDKNKSSDFIATLSVPVGTSDFNLDLKECSNAKH